MALSEYYYIENYSNIGIIGISLQVIGDIIKESLKSFNEFKISKSISCDFKDNIFHVLIPIKMKYGVNVNEIIPPIQERAQSTLLNMCDITNSIINIKVEGIIIE